MYAVIKTGGKQYRVQAGDLLVVEKLEGEPGAKIAFDQVLMVGEGSEVTVGEPLVAGASVSGALIETRKGDKIKIFKKIRRQGYRRTRGHRQLHSVVRVTSIAGAGKSETWDGTVDLTPLATLKARAQNLARGAEAAQARRTAKTERTAGSDHGEAVRAEPAPQTLAKAKTKAPVKAKAKADEGKSPTKAAKAPVKAKADADKAPAKTRPAGKTAETAQKGAAEKAPAKASKPAAKKES